MQTITLGKTRYIISDARVDILAAHAACTGKHKRVKSKGAEKRDYPAYWPDMSTAEYVALYEGKNARSYAMKLADKKRIPLSQIKLTKSWVDTPEQGVAEGVESLDYQGNCTEDEVVDEIFGDVNNFARMVEEHGDEFTVGKLVVKYDPETDIHSFYYKKSGVASLWDWQPLNTAPAAQYTSADSFEVQA